MENINTNIVMKKLLRNFVMCSLMVVVFALSGFAQQGEEDLPESYYVGYRVVHHMAAVVDHLEQFGVNTFEHPPVGDHRSFVISPALDHFYSKAVADVRFGPVVIETPARDDRYASIQIFDMEHYSIYDKITATEGERFILVHEDYKGKLPKGTVVKTQSNFPFIFIRTQTFSFNNDKLSNSIRHQATISGVSEPIDLPSTGNTKALIQWTIDNKKGYEETRALMAKAAKSYTPELHKQTYKNLGAFAGSGGLVGNVGMFESVDHPSGGTNKVRAAGTLMGHLGLPVHHAYYQPLTINAQGKILAGKDGPFALTLPYESGVKQFWSVTRYGAKTFLPLDPAIIGGNDIQTYNTFNMKSDKKGNITITFAQNDPKDGTYWMPVTEGGYYIMLRYYGPAQALNGNTMFDIVYKGSQLEEKFKPVQFK